MGGASPSVVIVADDLSGALDSAAAFAARGMYTVAARTPDLFRESMSSGADVVALSTGTRDLGEAAAQAVLEAVAEEIRSYEGILFKKVDSRLKGNVSAELDVFAGLRPRALICPAVPRLGRFVRAGAVVGVGVIHPIDIAARTGPFPATIVDAEDIGDIASALEDPLDDCLFIGAAGLAEALASRVAAAECASGVVGPWLPALLAIGSRDPVTLEQVEALTESDLPFAMETAPNGLDGDGVEGLLALHLVQMVPGETSITSAMAIRNFAEIVAARFEFDEPNALFACGGECANAVMGRLGIGLLTVHGEILPGIPISSALDGRPGLRLLTKSGGFGSREALITLCKALQAAGDQPLPEASRSA